MASGWKSFKFRNNPGLLGIVTNFVESQAYLQNTIHSPSLEALCAFKTLFILQVSKHYAQFKTPFILQVSKHYAQ